MNKVFIDGQAGTTGLKIHEYLAPRDDIELLSIPEADRKNEKVKHDFVASADVVILCLPDEAARETVRLAANTKARMLDASTAHRVNDDWVYGLPELCSGQREAIGSARYVSNPGCYPTGFLLAIAPLTRGDLLNRDTALTISAVSGYTGGGKSMIERYEARAATSPDALWYSRPYGLSMQHKHVPEMQHYAGLNQRPLFLPSVGHYPQGMLVSVPLANSWFSKKVSLEAIYELLADTYGDERCVTVHEPNDESTLEFGQLEPQSNNGTNRVDLFVFGTDEQVLLIARLDNLGKGASGAAVQNLNLMLGLPEFEGITT